MTPPATSEDTFEDLVHEKLRTEGEPWRIRSVEWMRNRDRLLVRFKDHDETLLVSGLEVLQRRIPYGDLAAYLIEPEPQC